MYAVVKVGGKQYRVEKGETLLVDRMSASEGDKVTLDPLLLADGKNTVFEGGDLAKIKVEAVVTGHERGPKIHVLKFKPKRAAKPRASASKPRAAAKPKAEAEATEEKPKPRARTKKEADDGS